MGDEPIDWSAADAMTEAQRTAAAQSDPDNSPLTDADLSRMPRTPQVRVMRRALRLTQEEFAAQFQIPLGTLRDWEQGRTEPDQPARAYLRVIASNPDMVRAALGAPTERGGTAAGGGTAASGRTAAA